MKHGLLAKKFRPLSGHHGDELVYEKYWEELSLQYAPQGFMDWHDLGLLARLLVERDRRFRVYDRLMYPTSAITKERAEILEIGAREEKHLRYLKKVARHLVGSTPVALSQSFSEAAAEVIALKIRWADPNGDAALARRAGKQQRARLSASDSDGGSPLRLVGTDPVEDDTISDEKLAKLRGRWYRIIELISRANHGLFRRPEFLIAVLTGRRQLTSTVRRQLAHLVDAACQLQSRERADAEQLKARLVVEADDTHSKRTDDMPRMMLLDRYLRSHNQLIRTLTRRLDAQKRNHAQ